ncbi:hypothetical protein [Pengzhenrongella frigida]|nr:hypothetical protein [Cellulomonas sp. HLT2-17]
MTESSTNQPEPAECPICAALTRNLTKHTDWHGKTSPEATIRKLNMSGAV